MTAPPLIDVPDDELWRDRALCAQTDPEAFFPEKGGSVREAKQICLRCEVRAECLEYALTQDERFGIWAGTTPRQRAAMRAKRTSPPRVTLVAKYARQVSDLTRIGVTNVVIARRLGISERTVDHIKGAA